MMEGAFVLADLSELAANEGIRMRRRCFLQVVLTGAGGLYLGGCRSGASGRVVQSGDAQMVGSHQAGSETYKPLVDESVAKLLGRHCQAPGPMIPAAYGPLPPKRICFLCVENKSAEEIGDFRDQLYQTIDSKIVESGTFQPISKRFVDAGLTQMRMRPDQLLLPENMRMFAGVMEQQGQPFDYLLYATITSGTTRENKDYQREYLLTLEMLHVQTGAYDKQSATLTKAYHHSRWSRFKMNPFK